MKIEINVVINNNIHVVTPIVPIMVFIKFVSFFHATKITISEIVRTKRLFRLNF